MNITVQNFQMEKNRKTKMIFLTIYLNSWNYKKILNEYWPITISKVLFITEIVDWMVNEQV